MGIISTNAKFGRIYSGFDPGMHFILYLWSSFQHLQSKESASTPRESLTHANMLHFRSLGRTFFGWVVLSTQIWRAYVQSNRAFCGSRWNHAFSDKVINYNLADIYNRQKKASVYFWFRTIDHHTINQYINCYQVPRNLRTMMTLNHPFVPNFQRRRYSTFLP